MSIGFIGQGYIGKNLADNLSERGYEIVRYALEEPYASNKADVAKCDVVFIAVPAPTTPAGVDTSVIEEALSLVGEEAIAVIKSTILPGTTKRLQDQFPAQTVLFSPEFLSKATARYDTDHPFCSIVGYAKDDPAYVEAARTVLSILPEAPESFVTTAETAELFKYMHNVHGFVRIVLSNLYYDAADKLGSGWGELKRMIESDPMMSNYYNDPVHQSGRGAGGCCFIKDFAAFRQFYEHSCTEDAHGIELLKALETKNLELLRATNKNPEYIAEVYGEERPQKGAG